MTQTTGEHKMEVALGVLDEVEVEPPIQEVEVESPIQEVQVESPYPWSDSDDTDKTLSPPTTPTYQQECAMTVNGVCKIEGCIYEHTLSPPTTPTYQQECAMTVNGVCKIEGCRQCGGTLRGFVRKRKLE